MRTRARKLDPDQIQANLNNPQRLDELQNPKELDVDKAGLGLFYCVECDRNFPSQKDQLTHIASKLHKRRAKKITEEPAYTIEESLRAVGMGIDNKQRTKPEATKEAA
jgi:bud site selection protein 20